MSSSTRLCRSPIVGSASTAAVTSLAPWRLVEDPGADVERLRRDAQTLGDLLQDLRTRLLQPPLDLAEVGVGHAGGLGELPQGDLRGLALLPDVVTQRGDLQRCHASVLPQVLTAASTQQAHFGVSLSHRQRAQASPVEHPLRAVGGVAHLDTGRRRAGHAPGRRSRSPWRPGRSSAAAAAGRRRARSGSRGSAAPTAGQRRRVARPARAAPGAPRRGRRSARCRRSSRRWPARGRAPRRRNRRRRGRRAPCRRRPGTTRPRRAATSPVAAPARRPAVSPAGAGARVGTAAVASPRSIAARSSKARLAPAANVVVVPRRRTLTTPLPCTVNVRV